jgi:hypothetical protein
VRKSVRSIKTRQTLHSWSFLKISDLFSHFDRAFECYYQCACSGNINSVHR